MLSFILSLISIAARSYPPGMSQAVSAHDASRESFAHILNRLAHAPSDSLLADDDAVRVSISERGSALSHDSKRALVPARAIKQNATRSHTDANEISYERALRLHSRPRSAQLPVQPPVATENVSTQDPSKPQRRTAGAAGSKASATANKNEKAKKRATQPASALPKSIKAATPPLPKRHAHTKKAVSHAPDSVQGNAPRRSSAARQTIGKNTRDAQAGLTHSAASIVASVSSAPSTSSSSQNAQLELAARITALAQRQTIVSIRVNAIESEQLRQRAAESGISVSAYMRSCVLEAEHLRAQVKQALAEMRASQAVFAAQTPLPGEPAPAPLFSLTHRPVSAVRTGLAGFFSGIAACVLGRLHR